MRADAVHGRGDRGVDVEVRVEPLHVRHGLLRVHGNNVRVHNKRDNDRRVRLAEVAGQRAGRGQGDLLLHLQHVQASRTSHPT